MEGIMRLTAAAFVALALIPVGEVHSQGVCPPDDEKPRALMERAMLSPVLGRVFHDAGVTDFSEDAARVLSTGQDTRQCGLLRAWVGATFGESSTPRMRWTFYEAGDRYVAVRWVAPASPGEGPIMLRVTGAAVLDRELNLLTYVSL
jgi:hypothetical protein